MNKYRAYSKQTGMLHLGWSEDHECELYLTIFSVNDGDFEFSKSTTGDVVLCGSYEGAVLMQSTGLTDKNGKEIFEGDIGKRTIKALVKDAPDWWDIWEVKFYKGGYLTHLLYDEKPDHPFFTFGRGKRIYNAKKPNEYEKRFHEIEIIGNIHENPELK